MTLTLVLNLGASFLLGGLEHHVQEFNLASTRLQAVELFLATIALLVPSAAALSGADAAQTADFAQQLSFSWRSRSIATCGLGLLFSLRTHREVFATAEHAEGDEAPWSIGVALATLAAVTLLVALVSEVFVESVQGASLELGMTPAFVGFIVRTAPMNLQFWPGAVVMMLIATLTASLISNNLLPPRAL